ncbi:hypothetical protein GCM10011360_15790 [Primorskyibacter flagellatus]|uniref:VPLPA-CTERM protein sorting domain-containing protein n=1 Tax=Primorskyibacter flagellatus TaxID=1387277 RepID=A0A917A600_9RHOB|nr:VPLPA-CTERM sorting domain-containing protein [Primorskyibacter flagellatus]GGE28448.1 hypothetical protein GCM10011360_15790 [Primorskyibacter flagellatus]
MHIGLKAAAVAAALVLGGASAQAATVTIGNYTWNENDKGAYVSPVVTIMDTATGVDISVGLTGTTTGKLSAFYFDVAGTPTVGIASPFVLKTNTNDVGGGNPMNGDMDYLTPGNQSAGNFDFGVAFNKVLVTPTAYSFSLTGLTAADFERVGLRFKDVTMGAFTDESNKIIGYPVSTPAVPLPAGGVLLVTALGAAVVARRKSRRF